EPVVAWLRVPPGETFPRLFRRFRHWQLPRAHAGAGGLGESPGAPAPELVVDVEAHLALALRLLVCPPEKRHHLMPHFRRELRTRIVQPPPGGFDLILGPAGQQSGDFLAFTDLWFVAFDQSHGFLLSFRVPQPIPDDAPARRQARDCEFGPWNKWLQCFQYRPPRNCRSRNLRSYPGWG